MDCELLQAINAAMKRFANGKPFEAESEQEDGDRFCDF